MKFYPLIFLFVFVLFQGCLHLEEPLRIASFWTDIELAEDTEYVLFINDVPSGIFRNSFDEVTCGESGMIHVEIIDDVDMNLEVRTDKGDMIDIGMINLFSTGTGIQVKSSFQEALLVKHELDENCTRVRVRW